MSGTAFIYCRISQDRKGAGLAISRQREDCERLAAERQLRVVDVFEDNDMSAYSGKPRPSYRAMIERLREVDAVVVWHTDRLHRSSIELEEWIAKTGGDRASVTTLTVQAGDLDLNTADGRLRARISGAVASHESERKAERVKRKINEKITNGEWIGGPVPFGWNADGKELVINEDEAAIVRDFTQRVIRGASLGSLARELQDSGRPTNKARKDGTPSKKAGRWTPERVREMLLRARNAGLIELKNKATGEMDIVGTAKSPTIVTETQWRACVRVLTDPKRRTNSKTNRPVYLLGGIGHCNCGALLRSSGGNGPKDYKCSLPTSERAATGPHTSRKIEPVDRLVRIAALSVLVHQRGWGQGQDSALNAERQQLTEELAEIEAQELDVVAAVGKSRVTGQVLLKLAAERERIELALADLEDRQGRATLAPVYLDYNLVLDAQDEWNSWSIDRRRDWIRRNLRVTIRPRIITDPRVFCSESIEIRLWDGAEIPPVPGERFDAGFVQLPDPTPEQLERARTKPFYDLARQA